MRRHCVGSPPIFQIPEKHGDIRDEVLNNPVCYEEPEETVDIFIDDVNVKRQEESRQKGGRSEKGKRKYVHNTIAHVSKEDRGYYILNGYGIRTVLCFLTAFIFNNDLIGNRWQFFTDGHKILNETILKCFNWFEKKEVEFKLAANSG